MYVLVYNKLIFLNSVKSDKTFNWINNIWLFITCGCCCVLSVFICKAKGRKRANIVGP